MASGSSRHDCSLGLIAKNFMTLLEEAEDGCVDRNVAADLLQVCCGCPPGVAHS